MSEPRNRDLETLTPENSAMLLIDHQTGTMLGVQDIRLSDFRSNAPVIYRPGMINAWNDPRFVAAVAATGRTKLIMAGVTTDMCLRFPALSALAAGYDVYAVYGASGCWDMMSELASILRLNQAGAISCNWAVIAAELRSDWRRPTAMGTLTKVVHAHLPFYGMLMNNQEVTKAGGPVRS